MLVVNYPAFLICTVMLGDGRCSDEERLREEIAHCLRLESKVQRLKNFRIAKMKDSRVR